MPFVGYFSLPCTELESVAKFHPTLVIQTVGVLNHVPDEGCVFCLERVVEHASPTGGLEVVLTR